MTQAAAKKLSESSILHLEALAAATPALTPFPHVTANGLLDTADYQALYDSFPEIKKPGFFPLSMLKRQGAFDELMRQLEGPEIAALLSEKLGLELRDKPRMITIRKWSAGNDGRIHNDGEAKICTSLLYLNKTWDPKEGGAFRVLTNNHDFEAMTTEVAPLYGTFLAFKRTDDSWHGHKPFTGERRVIQITWLRSHEDLARKEKRGRLSHALKRLFYRSEY